MIACEYFFHFLRLAFSDKCLLVCLFVSFYVLFINCPFCLLLPVDRCSQSPDSGSALRLAAAAAAAFLVAVCRCRCCCSCCCAPLRVSSHNHPTVFLQSTLHALRFHTATHTHTQTPHASLPCAAVGHTIVRMSRAALHRSVSPCLCLRICVRSAVCCLRLHVLYFLLCAGVWRTLVPHCCSAYLCCCQRSRCCCCIVRPLTLCRQCVTSVLSVHCQHTAPAGTGVRPQPLPPRLPRHPHRPTHAHTHTHTRTHAVQRQTTTPLSLHTHSTRIARAQRHPQQQHRDAAAICVRQRDIDCGCAVSRLQHARQTFYQGLGCAGERGAEACTRQSRAMQRGVTRQLRGPLLSYYLENTHITNYYVYIELFFLVSVSRLLMYQELSLYFLARSRPIIASLKHLFIAANKSDTIFKPHSPSRPS